MSQINIYLPSGFSNEEKHNLIYGLKGVLAEACEPKMYNSTLCIREYRPEDARDGRMSLIMYTTVNKPDEMKEAIASGFDKLCRDLFGDKCPGTFVTFQEHTRSHVCRLGRLSSIAEAAAQKQAAAN